MSKKRFLDPTEIDLPGKSLSELIKEIQTIYLSDSRPWVVGFSGGKDSTATLQLTYTALLQLKPGERLKPVFVVSSDTLVETPLVVDLFVSTLRKVEESAKKNHVPLYTARVHPEYNDTFWVNLLGKGYPAPTRQFRWCTSRMKISPISRFIEQQVNKYGEVVVVLGARSAESATRAQVIRKHKIKGQRLSRHTTLTNAYVYTPIEEWTTDNVWRYLFSGPAPWGGDHQRLFDLYKGTNAGECPLVVDTNTPSCGNSRFGCWVCTVVTEDRALKGLIETGEKWLTPLYDFRNLLFETTKPENKNTYRNYRRRSGKINTSKKGDAHVPGPYLLAYRKEWLKEILKLQKAYREQGKDITLITELELHEIRKEWIQDPNEPDWEDSLPRIYHEVFGTDIEWTESDAGAFTKHDADLLRALGKVHGVPSELVMKLLELELSMDGLSKRAGIYNQIDQLLDRDWGNLSDVLAKQLDIEKKMSSYEEQEQTLLKLAEDLRNDNQISKIN